MRWFRKYKNKNAEHNVRRFNFLNPLKKLKSVAYATLRFAL